MERPPLVVVLMPFRAFDDSDSCKDVAKICHICGVLMPFRAFDDSDRPQVGEADRGEVS